MEIEAALKRIKWRVEQSSWNNPQDIQAFNTILEHFELNNKATANSHSMFAKMMVVYIMQHARGRPRPMSILLREIEEIMQKPVITHLEEFKEEVPLFAFELITHKGTEGLDPLKDYGKIKQITLENMRRNQVATTKALKTNWTVKQAQDFLEAQVNKLVTAYNDIP